jgi:tetraacyldisaccharide 4'-kinase
VIVTRKAAALDDAKRVEERVHRAAPAVDSAIVHLGLGGLHIVHDGAGDAPSDVVWNAGRDSMHDCAPGAPGVLGAATRTQAAPIPASALAGQRILAISAIGDASAFTRQLASLGALVEPRPFVDHHRFTAGDAARLAEAAARMARGASDVPPVAVCTLKDAVKLAPLWPREAPPLWYVSQQPEVESGRVAVDALLTAMLAARHRQP